MTTVHPIYPPFLQEALDHAARLVDFLTDLETRTNHKARRLWLVGRAAEVECIVDAVAEDWARGATSDASATRSILAYTQILHRGLAVQFGELAPSCCRQSLVVTATPISLLAVTPAVPSSVARSGNVDATWELSDADLLDATFAPSSD